MYVLCMCVYVCVCVFVWNILIAKHRKSFAQEWKIFCILMNELTKCPKLSRNLYIRPLFLVFTRKMFLASPENATLTMFTNQKNLPIQIHFNKYWHIKTGSKSQLLHCIWETNNNKTHIINICQWLSVLLTMKILVNIIFY